ncbi:MAG: calcium/sodium antiporter [Planctomycetes bacterium]|nr:calcium/sodium antiporter [Planctomycetota bacterium]
MIIDIIILLFSFILLYYGANWLVDGASSIAIALKLSKVFVGIVLVAFGTSAPELFVNLIAAYHGHTGFALSNISGSNLANLCIGFGICAFFGNLIVDRSKFWLDLIYFSLSPLLILLLIVIVPGHYIPSWSAIFFCVLFLTYLMSAKQRLREEEPKLHVIYKGSLYKDISIFLVGITFLYLGGRLVLHSVMGIGQFLGVPDTILGFSIVALGTSLPDIMASIIAIRKNEISIAVGNILGSNIFNILLVIGGTLIVSRGNLKSDHSILMDYSFVFIISSLFACIAYCRGKIGRLYGLTLLVVYFAYMFIKIFSLN